MMLYVLVFCIVFVLLYSMWSSKFGLSTGGDLSGGSLNHVQDLFFRTVFTLLGYVAKRDGPVNDKEIKRTETYMEKMELDANQKREAIRLFKVGANPQFNADITIKEFHGLAQKSPNLAQILLVYLINLARVDGVLVGKEVDAVQKVATGLGYSTIMFKHLLQMISSQYNFGEGIKRQNNTANNQQKTEEKSSQAKTNSQADSTKEQKGNESCAEKTEDFNTRNDQLGAAYDVFDVSPDISDQDLKKAYRTLVNQYHPDKLMGQGLPSYMIQSATECFKTIQAAYDYIKAARAK